jgi:hypothetical protein
LAQLQAYSKEDAKRTSVSLSRSKENEGMIESLAKILDSLAKYSWGMIVVCSFILFVPDEQARKIGIIDIRETYKGYLWVGLVFAAAIWISSISSKINRWIVNKYDKRKRREVIIKRLYALNLEEKMWIAYCLHHNVQTLHATQVNSTANSLMNKGIVAGGSGSILSLPFTIVDYVWLYLTEHRDVFLPQGIADNQEFLAEIEEFGRGLTRVY